MSHNLLKGASPSNNIKYSGDLETELVRIQMVKRGWMPNGLVLECHLNTGQPNHLNTGQMAPFCFLMYWSGIQMVGLVQRTEP